MQNSSTFVQAAWKSFLYRVWCWAVLNNALVCGSYHCWCTRIQTIPWDNPSHCFKIDLKIWDLDFGNRRTLVDILIATRFPSVGWIPTSNFYFRLILSILPYAVIRCDNRPFISSKYLTSSDSTWSCFGLPKVQSPNIYEPYIFHWLQYVLDAFELFWSI